MARYNFRSTRLFVEPSLAEGATVPLAPNQANYLVNVLRMKPGAAVLVFNGRDGEWRAEAGAPPQKAPGFIGFERVRGEAEEGVLEYLFPPLKKSRLAYVV